MLVHTEFCQGQVRFNEHSLNGVDQGMSEGVCIVLSGCAACIQAGLTLTWCPSESF